MSEGRNKEKKCEREDKQRRRRSRSISHGSLKLSTSDFKKEVNKTSQKGKEIEEEKPSDATDTEESSTVEVKIEPKLVKTASKAIEERAERRAVLIYLIRKISMVLAK